MRELFSLKNLCDNAKDWSTKKYDKNAFQEVLRSSKYSERTAPYKKCLEFVTPTEANATKGDAPPDTSWKRTICAEPEKTIKEVA